MRHVIVVYLPWLISAATVAQVYMTGNKHRHAWTLGLVCQVMWSTWIVSSENWGLVPLNLALWVLYVRNHILWRRPDGNQ